MGRNLYYLMLKQEGTNKEPQCILTISNHVYVDGQMSEVNAERETEKTENSPLLVQVNQSEGCSIPIQLAVISHNFQLSRIPCSEIFYPTYCAWNWLSQMTVVFSLCLFVVVINNVTACANY